MPPQTPYTKDLGDREPLAAMREAVGRIGTLVAGWTPAQFERSYAPGKWTTRQILIHLVQTEIALGNRARMALATPNYTAQAFDQDRWMDLEAAERHGSPAAARGVGGADAAAALAAMNVLNRTLFASLTAEDRATPFAHPEYGALSVDWLVHQMAGHLQHHLVQIEEIARK